MRPVDILERYIGYLSPREGEILLALIFVTIAYVTGRILELLADRRYHRRIGRIGAGKLENVDRKKMYPVMVGALIGYSIASPNLLLAVPCAVSGGLLGYLGVVAYNWFVKKLTEEKKAGEVLLLYEVVSVYAVAGYSLYEALTAGAYLVRLIKDPLRRCLNSWGQGPERALQKLGKELGLPEADALVRILQRALVIGPGRLAEYLSQEGKTMENVRQFRIERGLGVRPIIQTLYLLLPGLALVGVTLMPVGYHISKLIMSIKLK
ncbi:hypothetical protein [Desulfofundulus sp.]|uniref:hypothetical protein n=1 Tax=Desulfofundulus sp. TaxID=2282750 RepID=UPI003C70A980